MYKCTFFIFMNYLAQFSYMYVSLLHMQQNKKKHIFLDIIFAIIIWNKVFKINDCHAGIISY